MQRLGIGEDVPQCFVAGTSFLRIRERLRVLHLVARVGDRLRHRLPLHVVAVEDLGRTVSVTDERKLPRQVERVLEPRVHAVTLEWGADVSRVTGEENAARAELPCNLR